LPFVLKHKQTSQIATDTLINSYELPYYGTKFWNLKATADEEYAEYLKAHGLNDASLWEVTEVEESQMKIYNVKLKNDPSLRLFLNEQGKPMIKPADV
jgi:hypothetical protein